ncbi:MAG: hypothetical protein ACM3U1_09140 [Chloroflexota bacterium]
MFRRVLFIVAIAVSLNACGDEEDKDKIDISGITSRSIICEVYKVDPDDWKPLPGLTDISLCPNPVNYTSSAELKFKLDEPARVKVWAVNSRDETVLNIFDGSLTAGYRAILFSGLPVGLSRIYIQAGNKRTYGDVLVNQWGDD